MPHPPLTLLQEQRIQLGDVVTLHQLTIDDSDKLYELMRRIYRPSYGHMWYDQGDTYIDKTYCLRSLADDLQEDHAGYWIVECDDIAIGVLRVLWDTPYDTVGGCGVKLHRIYLDPHYSGAGIGGAIMRWVLNCGAKMGADHIWLEAMETAMDARRFYKRHNFTAVDRVILKEEHIRPSHEMMLQMVHRINPTL